MEKICERMLTQVVYQGVRCNFYFEFLPAQKCKHDLHIPAVTVSQSPPLLRLLLAGVPPLPRAPLPPAPYGGDRRGHRRRRRGGRAGRWRHASPPPAARPAPAAAAAPPPRHHRPRSQAPPPPVPCHGPASLPGGVARGVVDTLPQKVGHTMRVVDCRLVHQCPNSPAARPSRGV